MTLWTATEAARATGGVTNTDWTASGVSIDSRSLQPGDLFVALDAARDGHEFVADALAKGACAALVSRRPPGVSSDAPLLTVADVQRGLEDLGRAARARICKGCGHHRVGRKNIHQRNAARNARAAGGNACLCGQLQQPLGGAFNIGPNGARRRFCSDRDRYEPPWGNCASWAAGTPRCRSGNNRR